MMTATAMRALSTTTKAATSQRPAPARRGDPSNGSKLPDVCRAMIRLSPGAVRAAAARTGARADPCRARAACRRTRATARCGPRRLGAGRILEAAMAGKSRPKTCRVACPMLDDPNGGRTDVGPIVPLYARALEHEAEAGIHCVSINAGFSDADIHDMGPTVLVTYDANTDGAEARAHTISQQIAAEIWEARNSIANDFLSVEDACAVATSFDTAKGPLVIADYADNPGSGAYGDATNLLAAMLDAGLKNANRLPGRSRIHGPDRTPRPRQGRRSRRTLTGPDGQNSTALA